MNDIASMKAQSDLRNSLNMALSRDFRTPELSTGQVSDLLQVHVSTVKRWFGDGGVVTSGGHRRIPLDRVLTVASERGHEVFLLDFGADAAQVWEGCEALDEGDPEPIRRLFFRWLRSGRSHLIGQLLEALSRGGGLPTPSVLDGVYGGFMQMVGGAWADGTLGVGEERAASRAVVETLLGLLRRHHESSKELSDLGRPTAVVGSMAGDQHYIGPLLVRTALVRRGWRVEYLGPDVPIEEFLITQRRVGASLVCVSFTPPLGAPEVHRFVRVLGDLAEPDKPFAVAVGGQGAADAVLASDPAPFSAIARITSLTSLDRWVAEIPRATEVAPNG
ncbi:MAG: MerR family transcriptional regulator [Longimicrobiales bacterium]